VVEHEGRSGVAARESLPLLSDPLLEPPPPKLKLGKSPVSLDVPSRASIQHTATTGDPPPLSIKGFSPFGRIHLRAPRKESIPD